MIPAPAFLTNPERFMAFSRWAAPMFGAIALGCALAGLWLGWSAPPDYQQSFTVRILFIHIPTAWMSEFVYACLAVASLLSLIWRCVTMRKPKSVSSTSMRGRVTSRMICVIGMSESLVLSRNILP